MVKFDLPSPPNDISSWELSAAIDYFLDLLYASGASERTVKAYRAALTDFASFVGPWRKISEITSSDVTRWLRARLRGGLRRPRTRRGDAIDERRRRQQTLHYYTLFLRGFMKWLGLKVEVPVIKKPPKPKIEALSHEEVGRLLSAARDVLDILIVALLFETGLRAREAVELRLGDIDPHTMSIRVRAAKYGEERIVFYGPLTAAALQEWLQQNPQLAPQDKLLGISYSALYKRLKSLAKRAGIDPTKVRPHVLRHTFATEALRRGMSLPAVQRLLGHHDIKVTEIYLHLAIDDLRRQYMQAFQAPLQLQHSPYPYQPTTSYNLQQSRVKDGERVENPV